MSNPKNINDKRSTKLDHVLAADYIPFLQGRPVRDCIIGKNDLLDLKIILNQTKSIQDFVAAM